jgi:glycosyltransferase involved in cell wall biosynthesis
MQKRISVVIPTYNRLNLLCNCLDALNRQSLNANDFEVIVVHDGPDERIFKELENLRNHYAYQLQVRYTVEKKGPAAARNLGWLSASGQLIAFTDDDCLPGVNWLSGFLDGYQNQEFIAYSGKTVVPLDPEPTDFALNTARLSEAEFITANCACTKAALLKVGGFDERFSMAWREDSDLEFKLLLAQVPLYRNEKAVVVHPVRQAPWGVSLKEQRKGIFDVLLFKKYPILYRQKIQKSPLWNYYLIVLLGILALLTSVWRHDVWSKSMLLCMFLIIVSFAYQRLRKSNRSGSHVAEMLVTSLFIPFLSVYYRIYGSIRYRKLLF